MTEPLQGLLILGLLAVASAVGWHMVVRRFGYAVLGAAGTATVLFQVAAYIHVGYLDPFFPIAVVISAILASGVAVIIGIPFKSRRRRAEGKRG